MTECTLTTNKKNLIEEYVKVYIKYLQYINSFKEINTSESYLETAQILASLKDEIITNLIHRNIPKNSENIHKLLNRIL